MSKVIQGQIVGHPTRLNSSIQPLTHKATTLAFVPVLSRAEFSFYEKDIGTLQNRHMGIKKYNGHSIKDSLSPELMH